MISGNCTAGHRLPHGKKDTLSRIFAMRGRESYQGGGNKKAKTIDYVQKALFQLAHKEYDPK